MGKFFFRIIQFFIGAASKLGNSKNSTALLGWAISRFRVAVVATGRLIKAGVFTRVGSMLWARAWAARRLVRMRLGAYLGRAGSSLAAIGRQRSSRLLEWLGNKLASNGSRTMLAELVIATGEGVALDKLIDNLPLLKTYLAKAGLDASEIATLSQDDLQVLAQTIIESLSEEKSKLRDSFFARVSDVQYVADIFQTVFELGVIGTKKKGSVDDLVRDLDVEGARTLGNLIGRGVGRLITSSSVSSTVGVLKLGILNGLLGTEFSDYGPQWKSGITDNWYQKEGVSLKTASEASLDFSDVEGGPDGSPFSAHLPMMLLDAMRYGVGAMLVDAFSESALTPSPAGSANYDEYFDIVAEIAARLRRGKGDIEDVLHCLISYNPEIAKCASHAVGGLYEEDANESDSEEINLFDVTYFSCSGASASDYQIGSYMQREIDARGAISSSGFSNELQRSARDNG